MEREAQLRPAAEPGWDLPVDAEAISESICEALRRHAAREGRRVTVAVEGGVVTLTGVVDSLPEHDAIIGTAFGAKGVAQVIDRLEVTL